MVLIEAIESQRVVCPAPHQTTVQRETIPRAVGQGELGRTKRPYSGDHDDIPFEGKAADSPGCGSAEPPQRTAGSLRDRGTGSRSSHALPAGDVIEVPRRVLLVEPSVSERSWLRNELKAGQMEVFEASDVISASERSRPFSRA